MSYDADQKDVVRYTIDIIYLYIAFYVIVGGGDVISRSLGSRDFFVFLLALYVTEAFIFNNN